MPAWSTPVRIFRTLGYRPTKWHTQGLRGMPCDTTGPPGLLSKKIVLPWHASDPIPRALFQDKCSRIQHDKKLRRATFIPLFINPATARGWSVGKSRCDGTNKSWSWCRWLGIRWVEKRNFWLLLEIPSFEFLGCCCIDAEMKRRHPVLRVKSQHGWVEVMRFTITIGWANLQYEWKE